MQKQIEEIPRIPESVRSPKAPVEAPDFSEINPIARRRKREELAAISPAKKTNDQKDIALKDEDIPDYTGDIFESDTDGEPVVTEEEFARDMAEAEAELAKKDAETAAESALDKEEAAREKARGEAEAAWKERVEEYEAARNQDVIGETVAEAQTEAARAEKAAATKIGKAFRGIGDVFRATGSTIVEVFKYLREGTLDFAHDLSDTVFTTYGTDWFKSKWKNIFGKQNSALRNKGSVDPNTKLRLDNEHNAGAWGMLTMDVADLGEVWDGLVQIPGVIGRRLDEWGPEAMQESSELARDIEERAWKVRNTILEALEAEEKAIHTQRLSKEAFNEAMQNIQNRRDVADGDYNSEVQRASDITPSIPEAAVKGAVWWATRGVPKNFWAAKGDFIDYIAMDGLVKEMGQGLLQGLRQNRRRSFEKAHPGVPYSQDMITSWGPNERAMGVMERLGESIAGLAESLFEARDEHQKAIVDEAKNAQRVKAGIYQDAISTRIEALTEKTKMSTADRGEIAYLANKLARVRAGEVGAEELAGLIQRAETFAKSAESKTDDENLLLGYLAGRAINTIRSLNIMQSNEGDQVIRALQEDPSVENLKRAEALVMAHTERELQPAAENLLTDEHKVKLMQARDTLQDSVRRATELYKSNIAHVTAEITKGLQVANRELKKAAAQAEAAKNEKQAA